MSASLSTSVKKVIESASLSLTAFRDVAPAGSGYPYVTIHEGIGTTFDARGFGTGAIKGAVREVVEEVQIDLWQNAGRDEIFDLADRLVRALQEGRYESVNGKYIRRARVNGKVRQPPAPGATVIRTIVSLSVVRAV